MINFAKRVSVRRLDGISLREQGLTFQKNGLPDLEAMHEASCRIIYDDLRQHYAHTRQDAVGGFFNADLLRYTIENVIEEPKKIPQFADGTIIPLINEVPGWAESWEYTQVEEQGKAGYITYHSKDIPSATQKGSQIERPVGMVATSIQYTEGELRASEATGRQIARGLANAARNAIRYFKESEMVNGNPARNIYGLFWQPAISKIAAPNGLWNVANTDEIIQDLQLSLQFATEITEDIEIPNSVVMNRANWNILKNRRFTNQDSNSIMPYLEANFPEIDNWFVSSSIPPDRLVVFRQDPEAMAWQDTLPLTPVPVQRSETGLVWNQVFYTRWGGLKTQRPKSVTIMNGLR